MVHADRVQPFVDLEWHRFPLVVEGAPAGPGPDLQTGPAEHERPVGVVLEVGLRVDAAGDLDVARGSARTGQGDRVGDRHARGGGEQPAHPIARTERPQQDRSDDQGDEAEEDGHEGSHGRDSSGGQQKARRNLPDTWALMRSPPLVSLGPSGLGSTVGARRHHWQWGSSTEIRSIGGSYPPSVHRSGVAPGRRIDRTDLAVEPGEHESATDEFGGGHHVRVGDAPGDRPVRLDGERLQLATGRRRGRAATTRRVPRSGWRDRCSHVASPTTSRPNVWNP